MRVKGSMGTEGAGGRIALRSAGDVWMGDPASLMEVFKAV